MFAARQFWGHTVYRSSWCWFFIHSLSGARVPHLVARQPVRRVATHALGEQTPLSLSSPAILTRPHSHTNMTSSKTWLQRKLDEPCVCHSGRSYRSCCLRHEVAYLVIGTVAAFALFGTHDLGLIAVIPILLIAALAGWFVSRYFRRSHKNDKKS